MCDLLECANAIAGYVCFSPPATRTAEGSPSACSREGLARGEGTDRFAARKKVEPWYTQSSDEDMGAEGRHEARPGRLSGHLGCPYGRRLDRNRARLCRRPRADDEGRAGEGGGGEGGGGGEEGREEKEGEEGGPGRGPRRHQLRREGPGERGGGRRERERVVCRHFRGRKRYDGASVIADEAALDGRTFHLVLMWSWETCSPEPLQQVEEASRGVDPSRPGDSADRSKGLTSTSRNSLRADPGKRLVPQPILALGRRHAADASWPWTSGRRRCGSMLRVHPATRASANAARWPVPGPAFGLDG